MKRSKRLKELYDYQILDTPQEKELDDFAQLAALTCNTPFALISFIDKDRHWYKAKVGLAVREYHKRHPFTEFILKGNYTFIEVKNIDLDPRFEEELVVGEHSIKYYAGVTLKSLNGEVLGTLCVLHNKPYCLNDNQKNSLKIIASKVMKYLNDLKPYLNKKVRFLIMPPN